MRFITLEQKLRATGIARWHIVRTAVPQSLSDHLYSVAMISETILAIYSTYYLMNAMAFYQTHRSRIIDRALHHDVLEVLTGDQPSPYKRWVKSATGTELPEPDHLLEFDNAGSATDSVWINGLLNDIIKLSDMLEAYNFIKRYAIDAHGRLAAHRLYDQLSKANKWMPEQVVRVDFMNLHTNAGGPVRFVDGIPVVDWGAFALHILDNVINATPEEISDDALEGGPVSGFSRPVPDAFGGKGQPD